MEAILVLGNEVARIEKYEQEMYEEKIKGLQSSGRNR